MSNGGERTRKIAREVVEPPRSRTPMTLEESKTVIGRFGGDGLTVGIARRTTQASGPFFGKRPSTNKHLQGLIGTSIVDAATAPVQDVSASAVQYRPNGSKRHVVADLPIPSNRFAQHRRQVLPRLVHALGDMKTSPWNLSAVDFPVILQEIWDDVFPDYPTIVKPRTAVHDVVRTLRPLSSERPHECIDLVDATRL